MSNSIPGPNTTDKLYDAQTHTCIAAITKQLINETSCPDDINTIVWHSNRALEQLNKKLDSRVRWTR